MISQFEDYLYVTNDSGTVSKIKSYGNTGALSRKLIDMLKTLCIDNN